MYQHWIWPLNAIDMPHMPITSCAHMRHLCQYIYFIWTQRNQQSPKALVYIYFTLLTYTHEQICLLHCICMSHYTNTVIYIWLHITEHVSQTSNSAGFELRSNMHIYYVSGNHIYCLSSMTTSVFLAWKTFLISVFMSITLEIVHTCV